jgi:hypothetical protein
MQAKSESIEEEEHQYYEDGQETLQLIHLQNQVHVEDHSADL